MSDDRKTTTAKTTKQGTEYQQKITRKKELFLLFYVTGNFRGDTLMYCAAKTRRQNIEQQPWFDKRFHLVFNVPIQQISEVIETIPLSIKKRGGKDEVKLKEVSIFSHSWFDGPTGSQPSKIASLPPYQMQIKGGWDSIDYNWATDARFVMFGCNSATDVVNARVFAKELSKNSKFFNVVVWGQPDSAYPSLYPDRRVTVVARTISWESENGTIKDWRAGWLAGTCYMVACERGQSLAAHRGIPLSEPEAKKMKKYKNGVLIDRAYQSEFNNHGK